jgi:hypothetical protein
MKRVFWGIMTAVVLAVARPAAAQLTTNADVLIANYLKAIDRGENASIDEAWQALNASPAALEKMKTEFPRVYRSFEYWRIKKELEELKARRFLNASFAPLSQEGGFSTSRDKERSNSQQVMDNPAHEERSNRSRVLSYPNQRRRPNHETGRDNPIQEQTSNQDRIRSRLRSLR